MFLFCSFQNTPYLQITQALTLTGTPDIFFQINQVRSHLLVNPWLLRLRIAVTLAAIYIVRPIVCKPTLRTHLRPGQLKNPLTASATTKRRSGASLFQPPLSGVITSSYSAIIGLLMDHLLVGDLRVLFAKIHLHPTVTTLVNKKG